MTYEQQQIALCEWAGWKQIQLESVALSSPSECARNKKWCYFTSGAPCDWLPDCNSLDVLAEFEARLINSMKPDGYGLTPMARYSDKLKCVIQDRSNIPSAVEARYLTAVATAAQRREALLRSLGLWKEETQK